MRHTLLYHHVSIHMTHITKYVACIAKCQDRRSTNINLQLQEKDWAAVVAKVLTKSSASMKDSLITDGVLLPHDEDNQARVPFLRNLQKTE